MTRKKIEFGLSTTEYGSKLSHVFNQINNKIIKGIWLFVVFQLYDASDFRFLTSVACPKGQVWLGGDFVAADCMLVWTKVQIIIFKHTGNECDDVKRDCYDVSSWI